VTIWNAVKQSQNKVSKHFSFLSHCWGTDTSRLYIQLFLWVMDGIITIIVLRSLHLHLFLLIFDKLKTGPRLTLMMKTRNRKYPRSSGMNGDKSGESGAFLFSRRVADFCDDRR